MAGGRKVRDWLEPDSAKFPNGLRPLADAAHESGFLAGLWLAPFVCEKESLLCKDHPDWLLQVDGQPWCCGCNWSGFYALDIDHPEVQAYLKQVFDRVLQIGALTLSSWTFSTAQHRSATPGNPTTDGCSVPWHCCAHGAVTS